MTISIVRPPAKFVVRPVYFMGKDGERKSLIVVTDREKGTFRSFRWPDSHHALAEYLAEIGDFKVEQSAIIPRARGEAILEVAR